MSACSRRLLFLSLLSLAVGCGEGTDAFKAARPKTVPASGKITYNGQPLGGATIVFAPDGGVGVGASTISQQDGTFALSAFPPEPGVVPGNYIVTVAKMSDPPPEVNMADSHDAPPSAPQKARSLIPEKFGHVAKSGLQVQIPGTSDGNTAIVLDLK